MCMCVCLCVCKCVCVWTCFQLYKILSKNDDSFIHRYTHVYTYRPKRERESSCDCLPSALAQPIATSPSLSHTHTPIFPVRDVPWQTIPHSGHTHLVHTWSLTTSRTCERKDWPQSAMSWRLKNKVKVGEYDGGRPVLSQSAQRTVSGFVFLSPHLAAPSHPVSCSLVAAFRLLCAHHANDRLDLPVVWRVQLLSGWNTSTPDIPDDIATLH